MNKNIKPIHNQKHLTLTDRTFIEQELSMGSSFRNIALILQKDPSTISKEIRKNALHVTGRNVSRFCYKCKHFHTCTVHGSDLVAKGCKRSSHCTNICKRCYREQPPFQHSNKKQVYRNKRTYVDFERFMEAHPESGVVEMDTVKGGRAAGKCLLTLLFRSCSFMLIILLPQCTQHCVINAINDLTEMLGLRLFRKYFPVILTDNGSEFKNPYDIEKQKMASIAHMFFTAIHMYPIKKHD